MSNSNGQHEWTVNDVTGEYKCKTCGFNTYDRAVMMKHVKLRSGERPGDWRVF